MSKKYKKARKQYNMNKVPGTPFTLVRVQTKPEPLWNLHGAGTLLQAGLTENQIVPIIKHASAAEWYPGELADLKALAIKHSGLFFENESVSVAPAVHNALLALALNKRVFKG